MERDKTCPFGHEYKTVSGNGRVKTCDCEVVIIWHDRGFGNVKPITNELLAAFIRSVHEAEPPHWEGRDMAGYYQRQAEVFKTVDQMEALLFTGMEEMDLFGERAPKEEERINAGSAGPDQSTGEGGGICGADGGYG